MNDEKDMANSAESHRMDGLGATTEDPYHGVEFLEHVPRKHQ